MLVAQGRCRALRDSVEMYINNGLHYKAEQLAKSVRILDICREEFGEMDTVFANVLGNLGTILYYKSDYRGALEFTQRADSIYLKLGFTQVQDYGSICHNYSVAYQRLGEMPKAEQYARQAIEISRLNGDTSSSRYLNRLNSLSTILTEQGKVREGLPIMRNALHVSEQIGDTVSQVYITLGLGLSRTYDAVGLYDSSLWVIEKILPVSEKVWKEHPFRPVALITRGSAQYRLSRYLPALQDYKQAQALCKDKNYFYAEALNGMALCNMALGRNDEALALQTEAIELMQRHMGKDYVNLSALWNNLGAMYITNGDAEKALPALLEGRRVLEKKVTKTQRNALDLQNNIGAFYIQNGFYEQALTILLECERNCREAYGTETSMYALTLSNLASAYAYLGLWDSSFVKSLESLQINQRLVQGNTFEIAMGLYNVAANYHERNQLDSAQAVTHRALQTFQALGDTTGVTYVRVLNALTAMYYEAGKRSQARTLNKRIVAHLAAHPHPDNPMYIVHVKSTALYCDWLDDTPQALRLFLQTDSLLDAATERLTGLYGYGADEAFARNYAPIYEAIADVMFRHRKEFPQGAALLYDNTLSLNHLLLHQTRSALESARNSPDSATAILAKQWNDLRQLVVKQNEKTTPDFPLDSLERELTDTENRLTAAYLPLYQARKKIDWRAVQSALAPGDAAIEFVRLLSVRDSSVRYIALLLRPGRALPEIVDLCDETALTHLLNRRIRSLPHTITSQYQARKNKASEAHDLLWRPLEKQLKNVHRVYFAPAGLLHQVAFAAIEDAQGRPLAERFHLEQLSGTRELAFLRQPLPGSAVQSAVLIGGVSYRCDSASLAEAGRRVACTAPEQPPLLPVGAAAAKTMFGPGFLPPGTRGGAVCSDTLPGTAREQRTLAGILAGNGTPVQVHTGSDALEQHIKCFRPHGQSPPGLLHIGTHGIYLPAAEKKKKRLDGDTFRWAENPMFRSYLVMAGGGGACGSGQIPVGTRDEGLLTAYEIATLNFSGTQLVTLSACVSALGDVRDAEGVYGLQRAFKIAGARHLLLTLWPVDDTATEAFMEKFYRYWLTDNLDIHTAFRQTQADFRADARYAHPYYWAGFVLI